MSGAISNFFGYPEFGKRPVLCLRGIATEDLAISAYLREHAAMKGTLIRSNGEVLVQHLKTKISKEVAANREKAQN
eukprot:6214805-Pleurochrysis_carterae.AAC.8